MCNQTFCPQMTYGPIKQAGGAPVGVKTVVRASGTPGPWSYQERSDAYTHIVRGPGNLFICQLGQDTSGRAEADARLIAAAPDLLRELERLVTYYEAAESRPEATGKLQDARAAIAKALNLQHEREAKRAGRCRPGESDHA